MTSFATTPATMSEPLPSFAFGTPASPPFTPSSSGIKRRAPSPPSPDGQKTPLWSSPATASSSPNKKRRPNLANGFSGLSISGIAGPSPAGAHATEDIEDDEEPPSGPSKHRDIGVEVLPDTPSASKRSANRKPWPHGGSASSSTSENESENDYDSDATFRIPSSQRSRVQQQDSVHLPDHEFNSGHVLDIEDLTESLSNRKRRHRDADAVSQRTRKKKRDGGMDIDMDGGDLEDGVEEITRIPERGRTRKTHWHEPEKDRIVITSLSSSPSSRSSSRDSTSPRRHLTQPGEQGFTLSPSLLTHLLGTQKDAWNNFPMPDPALQQKGLVLYRPLGIPPGTSMQWDEIVKKWRDRSADMQDDSSRFEMVDDDEQLQSFGAESIMPVISEYTNEDVPMDVE